jgi:hypothetical protein
MPVYDVDAISATLILLFLVCWGGIVACISFRFVTKLFEEFWNLKKDAF